MTGGTRPASKEAVRALRSIGLGLLLLPLVAGCQTLPSSPPEIPPEATESGDHTLTLIVAQLQMHLRDDTYRQPRFRDENGNEVFELALWRLERLQAERDVDHSEWGNVDVVLEYARARALERSRRYSDAAEAYEHVASSGSLLAAPAAEAGAVMNTFARYTRPRAHPIVDPEERLEWINGRVNKWRELAWIHRNTSYEPLALEEAEVFEMERVEAKLEIRGLGKAIRSCHRLIERHPASKLYPRHLIRLGDLYAEAARREYRRHAVDRVAFDVIVYDSYLDRALSAYELAREQRRPALRAEANKKIEALLAIHKGVRSGVR